MDRLKIWVKGLLIEIIVSLVELMGTLSKPVAVPERNKLHKLIISCLEISSKNKEFAKFPERRERSDF